jgi:hypothetical protein
MLALSQSLTAVPRQAPLLLDDPQTVWIIQDGTMGLFTVPVKDGTPGGARCYLSSLGPGAALFGTMPAPGCAAGMVPGFCRYPGKRCRNSLLLTRPPP